MCLVMLFHPNLSCLRSSQLLKSVNLCLLLLLGNFSATILQILFSVPFSLLLGLQLLMCKTCEIVPQVPEALFITFSIFSSPFLRSIFKFIDSFICYLHSSKKSPSRDFFFDIVFFSSILSYESFFYTFQFSAEMSYFFFIHHKHIFLYPIDHSHNSCSCKSGSSWDWHLFFQWKWITFLWLFVCLVVLDYMCCECCICDVETLNSITLIQRVFALFDLAGN